jgi:hypothetical protein
MANIILNIESELPKAIRWTDAMTKQLPFAISRALNETGFDIRNALNGATRQYFNNPVPFTQRAFFVNRSNKRNLSVDIYAERRRARYLRTLISGGQRGQKPFELKFLRDAQASMPKGSRLVPAAIRLNAAGNVSLSALRKIEQQLSLKGRNSTFIGTPSGNNRPAGIYQRMAKGKLKPLFIATPQASYRSMFPMQEIGMKVAERRFGQYLRSSLEQAIATAR